MQFKELEWKDIICKRQIIGVYKKSTVCDILQSVLLDN